MSYILEKYLESKAAFNRWYTTQLNRVTEPSQYSPEDFKIIGHPVLTRTKLVSFSDTIWAEFVLYLENKESSNKEGLLENLFSCVWCTKALTEDGWVLQLTAEQAYWLKDYCKKNYSHKKEDWVYWALPLTTPVSTQDISPHPLDEDKLLKKLNAVTQSTSPLNRGMALIGVNSLLNGKTFCLHKLLLNSKVALNATSFDLLLPKLRPTHLPSQITSDFLSDAEVSVEVLAVKSVLTETASLTEDEALVVLNKTPGSPYAIEFIKAWRAISQAFATEFDAEKVQKAVDDYPAVFHREALSALWAKDPSGLVAYRWKTDINSLINEYAQLYRATRKSLYELMTPLLKSTLEKIGVNASFESNSYRINLHQRYTEELGAQEVDKQRTFGAIKWLVLEEICKKIDSFEEKMKDIFAEKQESFKIGFLILLSEHIAEKLSVNLEEVVQQTSERVRGWYDLSKVLTPAGQWVLIEYRKSEKELTLSKFVTHYSPVLVRERNYTHSGGAVMEPTADSPFMVYKPFDPRGGFVVNTYLAICEKYAIDPWPSVEDMHKFWSGSHSATIASARMAAMYLTYLYGMDIDAVEKRITDLSQVELDSAKKKRTAVYNAAKSLPGIIPAVEAEVMRTWRPLLIKYPKVLKYASNLQKVTPLQSTEDVTETQAVGLMIQHHYTGVPESLASHMLHALENSWDQSVVDHFVELSASAKTECYIPNIKFEKDGVKVYCLEPGDAVALYVGELSGCCQHINDGGGDDAAIQSFTEPWCSVLMIESANSGTLLAQSFLWTCEDKKFVVMDSVESVLETSNQSVRNLVYPALCSWIKKMKDAGFKVAISDATYGLTDTLRGLFEEDEKVKVEMISVPNSYDGLDYTDVSDEVYKLKIVS